MKREISKPISRLFCLVSAGVFLAIANSYSIAEKEEDASSPSAPEVITTITPSETQQADQVRPEYLQPVPVDADAPAVSLPIEPNQGETIVLLGNTLASRMEHFNFFETALQQQFPKKEITFRNMGFPGHTPAFRPEAGRPDPWAFPGAEKFRPEINAHLGIGHYPSPDEWLTILKANTIVAFFGFNESFDGLEGVENFKNELRAFVDHTLSRSYTRNDTQPPRLILATPIAMQQLTDYFLPDAVVRNQILKAYADAVKEVATEKEVGYVDLFTPTLEWFQNTDEPLTINGVHLSEAGYQKLAPVLMEQLFGQQTEPVNPGSVLHQAVQDKSWFWRNDYRMLNGVHAYGRRWAPYGNYNYPEEIEKIRQMTVLRDQNIWAIAQGRSSTLDVDDSQTRPLSPVETNYQVSEKNGTLDFLKTEEEAKATFTLPDGYDVSLFASEQEFPNLGNPAQMRFDNKGRLWVSTLPSYPHYKPGDTKPNDMLLIYEDTDGDGRADKETVFADGLHMPIGFEFGPEGVYLSQEPYLVLLKDNDGDDRADEMVYLLDGFDPHDTHHAISAFDVDNGGGIFMCEGRFLHSQVETPWGPERMTDGGVWRFDPASWKVERVMQSDVNNPWGVAHDEYGQTVVNDASGGAQYWMLGYSLKVPHSYEIPKVSKFNYEHHTRPTSGAEFLHSRHFPEEVQGDYMYANSIGFLGIKQYQVVEDGAEIKGKFRQDLIQSTDGNFRPCDLEVAPDGSLYFIDWHNTLIGHMQHSARDPLRNSKYGRIYRITRNDSPLVTPPHVAGASIEELFENMKLPELNARKWSHRELRARDREEVLAAATQFASENADNERLVLEALWATWGQQSPSLDLLNACLTAEDHRVRSAGVRVVRHCLHLLDHPETYLMQASTDEHPRVRLEALAAATWLGGNQGAEVVLSVATQPTDRWIRNALNSAMQSLKPEVEELLAAGRFETIDLTVNPEQFLASKLEGAFKPKDYSTKSRKFRDKEFRQVYEVGQTVFYSEGSCATCHREHGEGITRIYPPLAGSEWVTGDPDRLIKLTLHGLWGKIQVRGQVFEPTQGVPPMTALGNMFTDAEMASVLTYVRNSWGNDASEISVDDVKRIREETRSRRRFYNPEELIEMHPFPEGSRPSLVEDQLKNEKLEQQLLAESVAQLVQDAWEAGDPLEGAKIFYQEKTACATCHDAQEDFQLGPELTAAREGLTDEFLIESILNPSKSILKGYQSVTVITDDGRFTSGYLVEQTDEKVVLSIAAEKGKLREIPADQIEEIIASPLSTMPAGLVRSLADREEFLNLARFVLEVNKGGKRKLRALKREVAQ
ncbi:Alcohol dehydrogenase cytochrome c subunit precursor [Thalassoglobus neptunius]|uniref:Alcohol dehydrogenase cytochrome c subunit n=1 Tax=Thalassoglobus neptunius TaxID=1938619 RepID=A0A5C5X506_9PLAN|nr:PVC-type heme-binding CxxCH protein [Thalassoglobus neptunius]TWT57679.1 Alcohol dehydrogenase cytochrome c subunit precursor [Thalassoglobus neptunius]